MRLSIIGAGNMGEALVKGLLRSQFLTPQQLTTSDLRLSQREYMARTYGIAVQASNRDAIAGADVVILAVKPQILGTVIDEIATEVPGHSLVISLAAGRLIGDIEARFKQLVKRDVAVVRAMPNVACYVDAGAIALAWGQYVSEEQRLFATLIFDAVGLTLAVEERLLDAVTGLSGSGPAYVFVMIEALSDAGVKMGLSRWDAHALACQTVLGAAKLVLETGEHPGRLKDMVCSPGGTAISAIHTLEAGGLRTTLINAVEVATRRSQELGSKSGLND